MNFRSISMFMWRSRVIICFEDLRWWGRRLMRRLISSLDVQKTLRLWSVWDILKIDLDHNETLDIQMTTFFSSNITLSISTLQHHGYPDQICCTIWVQIEEVAATLLVMMGRMIAEGVIWKASVLDGKTFDRDRYSGLRAVTAIKNGTYQTPPTPPSSS